MPSSTLDKLGYWSPNTASVDWCEHNYIVSYYIAEFWNSLSSLFIIAIAVLGAYLCPTKEPRLLLICGMGATIGIGSTLFHSTLKYHMQLLDELPMLYTASSVIFVNYETLHGPQGIWLPTSLVAWLVVATIGASCTSGNIQFFIFQGSMIILEILVAYTAWAVYTDQTKNNPNEELRWLTRMATSSYLFAVVLWLIDLNFCDYTNGVPPMALLPFPLYLHAWWHIFSGIGSYLIIQATIYEHYQGSGLKPFVYMLGGIAPAIGLQDPKKVQ